MITTATFLNLDYFSEISGSLGDLGTLLPLLVSLSISNQVSLSSSLLFGGIYNIITGVYYDIPMAVQPMKSIAAIALLANLSATQVAGAGLSVSVFVFIFGLTRFITLIQNLIPLAIVRGIQLGTALSLFSKAADLILKSNKWKFFNLAWVDNFVIAILALLYVIVCYNHKRNYSAIILFLVGIAFSIIRLYHFNLQLPGPEISIPTPFVPSWNDISSGFMQAGLGQLPLTLLNSVIAVSVLVQDLFPKKSISTHSIAMSVGIMNIIGIWFGSVPYCHGSGGLAAQYRFGARTGVSIIFLGILKCICGIFFGPSLLSLFQQIPTSILGVMLVIAAMQLSSITFYLGNYESEEKKQQGYMVMILSAAAVVGFANDGIGFLVGCVTMIVMNYDTLYKSIFRKHRAERGQKTLSVLCLDDYGVPRMENEPISHSESDSPDSRI